MAEPAIELQNLARSCNEALILSCLETGPMHGYQIALEIQERGRGFFRFNYGTLYPILHQLEKKGLVKGTWSSDSGKGEAGTPGEGGRKRKQYILTSKGRNYARSQRSSWRDFISNFLHVLEVAEA
jgi:DNA-binding PadR family transcriptional regulator